MLFASFKQNPFEKHTLTPIRQREEKKITTVDRRWHGRKAGQSSVINRCWKQPRRHGTREQGMPQTQYTPSPQGAMVNQSNIPGSKWMKKTLVQRFFLINKRVYTLLPHNANYIFPATRSP